MDWQTLITGVVTTVVGTALVLLIRLAAQWLSLNMTEAQRARIKDLILVLVRAAEQAGLLENGAEKKAWVIDQAQAQLEKLGIPIDLATLDALVEAAVGELNDEFWKLEV
jgi:hypothetical protein